MKGHDFPSGRRGVLPGIEPAFRGKVRDIYDLGDRLIIVASDRISAYDSVLPTPIPGKGISSHAAVRRMDEMARGRFPHHILETDVSAFPPPFDAFARELGGRSMLVRKARRIDLECVVRGYLAGSGWKEYRESGAVCGIALPKGLRMSDRLEEPIFTPSTKADSGHDRNITIEEAGRSPGPRPFGRFAGSASRSTRRRANTRRHGESSSPIRSSNSASSTARSPSSTRCSRPIRRDSGSRTNTEPGEIPAESRQAIRAGLSRRDRLGSQSSGARADRGHRPQDVRALPDGARRACFPKSTSRGICDEHTREESFVQRHRQEIARFVRQGAFGPAVSRSSHREERRRRSAKPAFPSSM